MMTATTMTVTSATTNIQAADFAKLNIQTKNWIQNQLGCFNIKVK